MPEIDVDIRETPSLCALSGLVGVGPKTIKAIIANAGSLHEASTLAAEHLASNTKHPYLNRVGVAALADSDNLSRLAEEARREIETFEQDGEAWVISIYDATYPYALSLIDDAPMVIRLKGRLDIPARTVACVGTRDPNAFGVAVSRKMTTALCEANFAISSGLALGVDTICHETAMAHNAHTVAVLGFGFNAARRNEQDRIVAILESGGTVISEYPADMGATASTLMNRNRTVSGISAGLCPMQGSVETGGTRKAVSDAFRQGRPVIIPVPPAAFADPERDALISFARVHDKSHLAYFVNGKDDYPTVIDILESSAAEISPPPQQERTGIDRPDPASLLAVSTPTFSLKLG